MKKYLIVVLCIQFMGFSSYSGMLPKFLAEKYRFGEVKIFKLGPSFHNSISPKGGVLSFETGSGLENWSFNFSLKYMTEVDSTEYIRTVQEHMRFEFQSRYWISDYLNGLYFSPLVSVYNTGDVAGGLVLGFQFFLTNFLIVDLLSGIQTATPLENANTDFVLKYGLNMGIAFY